MAEGCCPGDSDSGTSEEAPESGGDQREVVRESYAETARSSDPCCGPGDVEGYSESLGYGTEELESAPDESNLGLGCGNPTALADLEPGETVVDLGSGPGFDCFLAAGRVGPDGRVIGVDMTPDMVERARNAAEEDGYVNVEFRLGEIENLPVADSEADAIISNCVINLSPDKGRVYEEAFRILKPGGRLAVSDIVRKQELPGELRDDPDALAGCVSGAAPAERHAELLRAAGFEAVDVRVKEGSDEVLRTWSDDHDLSRYLASAYVEARKPAG